MSSPISGNHNDLLDIAVYFDDITKQLTKAEIPLAGIFVNADAGFDSQQLKKLFQNKDMIPNIYPNKRNGQDSEDDYFDKKLYKERYSIERTNAWLDSFRLYLIDLTQLYLVGKLGILSLNVVSSIIIVDKRFNKFTAFYWSAKLEN